MKKILILVVSCILLANCSYYKPIIDPKTSIDPHTGKNIAGNYYRDLASCQFIYEQEGGFFIKKVHKMNPAFLSKCLKKYGHSILR